MRAAAALKDDARKQLDMACKLNALAELDDVVAGRRRFADLLPRV
jgi:hypothetical protein